MSIRIISGKFKGVALEVPKSARATLGRARQSLFDMLEASGIDRDVGHFFEDKTVLDCFAGSGAIGIEALSRGARHAYFVDIDPDTVKAIRANLARVYGSGKAGGSISMTASAATVLRSDIAKIRAFPGAAAIDDAGMDGSNCSSCDFIFMDPPFHAGIDKAKVLQHLIKEGWIREGSIVALESEAGQKTPLPIANLPECFERILERKIGSILVEIWRCRKINVAD